LVIDRDKAALLGIDMQTLSDDLSALLSTGFVNRFEIADRSYKVIPHVQRVNRRLEPEASSVGAHLKRNQGADFENQAVRSFDGVEDLLVLVCVAGCTGADIRILLGVDIGIVERH